MFAYCLPNKFVRNYNIFTCHIDVILCLCLNKSSRGIKSPLNFCLYGKRRFCKSSKISIDESCSPTVVKQYFGQDVDKSIIKKNSWVFELEPDIISKRIGLLKEMNLKCLEHGMPFLKLPDDKLLKLLKQIKQEENIVPHKNKLYYMSEKLDVDPYIMCDRISKRLFVYYMPFEKLRDSLETMLELGVKPQNILRDLWSLRYKKENIRKRLEKISKVNNDKIMPWMIRCPESVLERYMHLESTTKEILGSDLSTYTYLAKRLKTTPEIVVKMSKITHSIKTTRVSKLKEVIDYLLSIGYTENNIIEVSKIFAHSLQTIMGRKKILDDLGIIDRNVLSLKVFCRSKKDFDVFCKLAKANFYKKKNNLNEVL